MNTCIHMVHPFMFNAFAKSGEPTEEDIKKYKLYQCRHCKNWYSLL